jgi:hypothetical protein
MADLLAIIAFFANLAFFIWFGITLTSINLHLAQVADHAARQTRLLASIANVSTTSQPIEPIGAEVSSRSRKDFFSDDAGRM